MMQNIIGITIPLAIGYGIDTLKNTKTHKREHLPTTKKEPKELDTTTVNIPVYMD